VTGLRRFLEAPPPTAPPAERCEMCGVDLAAEHGHVVTVENRALLCACRPCYLLFTREGAGQGRYRAVPDRVVRAPEFAITDGQWDALQIPVGMAFFFRNSELGRVAAFYPSPAGATESLLPMDTWTDILAANPGLPEPADDVEALLLRKPRGEPVECFLVPIDVCYDLVGRVRMYWKGFDGGTEAHREIDGVFRRLRERAR
jgi:hypothetical protein